MTVLERLAYGVLTVTALITLTVGPAVIAAQFFNVSDDTAFIIALWPVLLVLFATCVFFFSEVGAFVEELWRDFR